jgi:uncharacterized protein (DUF433 family)
MALASNGKSEIIRTERGLTISGTRITLYDIMDHLEAQYPLKFIRDVFDLTDEQINTALSYIEMHRMEVEAEYQEILKAAVEIQQYWEEKNRDRFARIVASPRLGHEAVRAKLREQRQQRQHKSNDRSG